MRYSNVGNVRKGTRSDVGEGAVGRRREERKGRKEAEGGEGETRSK